MRRVAGYVLAGAVGALIYATIGALTPGFNFRLDPSSYGPIVDLLIAASMYFALGGIYGLPYTVLGTVFFWRWPPKSMLRFLAVGMLCPTAAILGLSVSSD